MRRLGLVVLALSMLAGTGMAQEVTFNRFSFGIGYGTHTLQGLPQTRNIHGTGSWTSTFTSGGSTTMTTGQAYGSFGGFDNYHVAVPLSLPFVVTYHVNPDFGVRATMTLLKGNKTDKSSTRTATVFNDTTYPGARDTTYWYDVINRSQSFDTKEDISGMPLEFELFPTIRFGSNVILTPSGGVGYYNYSIKGANSTSTENNAANYQRTYITYPGGNRTVTTTTWSTTYNENLSGKLPDMKYSGVGAFFGLGAEVKIYRSASFWAQWRKGGIPLSEKYTDTWTDRVGNNTNTYTDEIKDKVHVRQESFSFGFSYDF